MTAKKFTQYTTIFLKFRGFNMTYLVKFAHDKIK